VAVTLSNGKEVVLPKLKWRTYKKIREAAIDSLTSIGTIVVKATAVDGASLAEQVNAALAAGAVEAIRRAINSLDAILEADLPAMLGMNLDDVTADDALAVYAHLAEETQREFAKEKNFWGPLVTKALAAQSGGTNPLSPESTSTLGG